MRIDVTAEDIATGLRREACDCPIAKALNRATGKTWLVDGMDALENAKGGQKARLPYDAQFFIADFDKGVAVRPFSFELSIP